ncbi:MAG: type II toxin-antitoxin system HicB family antitoxin [Desulfobacterales bacterium]|nr:type II toxin-antitoxin system HicB family antitoxin [Desulfobacterales bacterium]
MIKKLRLKGQDRIKGDERILGDSEFVVRVDSSLHSEIAAAAVKTGKSLNQWVADTLNTDFHR